MKTTTVLQTVTPEMAKAYLSKNHNSRPINPERVKLLARIMSFGLFEARRSEKLLFNKDGYLINGQHRLSAVVESGCTVQMYMCFMDTASITTVDPKKTQ